MVHIINNKGKICTLLDITNFGESVCLSYISKTIAISARNSQTRWTTFPKLIESPDISVAGDIFVVGFYFPQQRDELLVIEPSCWNKVYDFRHSAHNSVHVVSYIFAQCFLMYSAIKTGLHEGRGDWNMLQRLWSLLMTYSCHNTGKWWSDYVETKRIDLVRGICR